MLELDAQSFGQQQGTVIVDFWAPWCGPCKQFGPIFEDAAKDVEGVTFAKINVDNQQELAQQFGVMSIPTVVLFKDGKPVDQFSGVRSKQDVIEFVKKHQ